MGRHRQRLPPGLIGVGSCCIGSVLMTGASLSTAAAPVPTSLSWQRAAGADSCIAEAELQRRIETRLGRSLSCQADAQLKIHGRIEPVDSSGGWKATLLVVDPAGETGSRELSQDAGPCSGMDEALELALVLMIDPDTAFKPPVEDPGPVTPPPISPQPSATQPAPPSPIPDWGPSPIPQPEWHGGFRLGAALGVGLLPSWEPAARIAAFVQPKPGWSLEVSASRWGSGDALRDARGSNLTLTQAGVSFCPRLLKAGRWDLFACGGLEVGALSASGFGFDVSRQDTGWTVHAEAGGGALLRVLGPVFAHGRINVLAPLSRTWITYQAADGTDQVLYRAPTMGGCAEIGFGFRFPS